MPFPTHFLQRMQTSLGEEYPAFLEALEQPSPISLRLHPTKKMAESPTWQPIPWHPEGRYLPERPVFTLDPAFHAGAYYVQEASSMFLREALSQVFDLQHDITALDLCAAPGGKTTVLLSALSKGSLVVANEVIQGRVPALKMNLEKWGFPNVAITNHDPSDFQKLAAFFDLVLVDAPCSGEGLFRKDSDAAAEWSPENAAHCALRQRRILTGAMPLVKPGGVLVYSTCTFNPAENQEVIAWMIKEGGFEYCPLTLDPSWGISEQELGYQFYPHKVKGEGFFIACLRKKGTPEALPKLRHNRLGDWQVLPQKRVAEFSDWLINPNQFSFYEKPNGEIMAVPINLIESFYYLDNSLKKRSFGIAIGEQKRKDFIPSHALALSNIINPDLPSVELDLQQALLFLKKENIEIKEVKKGWTLAKYKGLNIGWMKVLDNRTNNYLPNEWRVRMALPI